MSLDASQGGASEMSLWVLWKADVDPSQGKWGEVLRVDEEGQRSMSRDGSQVESLEGGGCFLRAAFPSLIVSFQVTRRITTREISVYRVLAEVLF